VDLRLQEESGMQARTVLDVKVDHLQNDVAELKSDIKRLGANLTERRMESERMISMLRAEISAVRKAAAAHCRQS
jgi:chromosome segregation ATPase